MKSRKPSIPYIIWMVVFTMIPIIMIGFTAFTDKNGNFSFQAFTNAFYYTNIFVKSLWIALISTAICLVLAYPLAYLLTRMKESTQNTLIMLLMIPMWMNFLLRIYAWVTLLQDNGPIDMMLSLLGIHSTYIGNTGAVILGMVYEYLPFMVLPIYTVMSKIDNGLIEAGSRFKQLYRIQKGCRTAQRSRNYFGCDNGICSECKHIPGCTVSRRSGRHYDW